MRPHPYLLLALSAFGCSSSLAAQSLLRDINPDVQNDGSAYSVVCQAGPLLYLAAAAAPTHLWRTDGTGPGTVPLAFDAGDRAQVIEAGDLDGSGRALLSVLVRGTTTTQELWVSDGTPNGTQRLLAMAAQNFTRAGAAAVFFSDAGGTGLEPWRSDGTAAGTYRLADLTPGPNGSTLYARAPFGVAALLLVRTATGLQLLRSDATVAGTVVLRSFPVPWTDLRIAVAGTTAYFTADDGVTGLELWRTDGTAPGTRMVADSNPGPGSTAIVEMTSLGRDVVFTSSFPVPGLWRSDGTAVGTTRLHPVTARYLTAAAGRVFFNGIDAATGAELWSTDGTAAGTRLEVDLVPGPQGASPSRLLDLGSVVVMQIGDGSYWRFAGTAAPLGVASPRVTHSIQTAAVVQGRAVISVLDATVGEEPWQTDGTAAGTTLLRDLRPARGLDSSVLEFVALGDATYFTANGGAAVGPSLWRTDGTPAGTNLVRALPGHPNRWLSAALDRLFIIGSDLWVSDGTTTGTRQLPGIVPMAGDVIASPIAGQALLGAADSALDFELWTSDGTSAGTRLLRDIHPSGSSFPSDLRQVGGQILFLANDGIHGRELWATDGTATGTHLVLDVWPGPFDSFATPLGVVGSRLLFTVGQGLTHDVWGSDATASGTVRLFAGPPAAFALAPSFALIAVGRDLYVTDGSVANTRLALRAPAAVRSLAIAADTIFVGLADSAGLLELAIVTAGPALTTVRRFPGSVSALLAITPVGTSRHVVFAAGSTGSRVDLWTSDGTPAGTQQLAALNAVTPPSLFHRQLDRLLFVASDEPNGSEPWWLPLRITGASVAAPRGEGCAGPTGAPLLEPQEQPSLGNQAFALSLRRAQPASAAAVWLGAALVRRPLGACWLYADPDVFVPLRTDAGGAVTLRLPVPGSTALLGRSLFAQGAAIDPAGPLPGGVVTTAGLHLVFGR